MKQYTDDNGVEYVGTWEFGLRLSLPPEQLGQTDFIKLGDLIIPFETLEDVNMPETYRNISEAVQIMITTAYDVVIRPVGDIDEDEIL